MQGWRANCDIQLVIDHHTCIEYLAKYAAKGEKISSIARSAFVAVVSNLSDSTSAESAIRKLMVKCVGERDMGKQGVMHQILSLKLYSSSFQTTIISLDNSKKFKIAQNDLILDQSHLEIYANRGASNTVLNDLNLVSFYSNYSVDTHGKITKRKTPHIIRTVPNFSGNPNRNKYGLYCKYQLLKYKPWKISCNAAWDNEIECDETFVEQWKIFLMSGIGQKLIPKWQRLLSNAISFFHDNNDLENETRDCEDDHVDDWMYIARRMPPPDSVSFCTDHIDSMRSTYSTAQLQTMPFWLENIKSSAMERSNRSNSIDISKFNRKQSIAYNMILRHYQNNYVHPISLIITGQGGSGKSFLINAFRELLQETCVVCSYFGIASHNIEGVTLHSLLSLPIRGLYQRDLTGRALTQLQERLHNKKYIIIDEFSVIGQKMLGWIDKRLRQASGILDVVFGGFSWILVGDIAQLPPVNDKPLFHCQRIVLH